MALRKEHSLLAFAYLITVIMYFLMEEYACYDCSTERLTYFYFLVGYAFVVFLLIRVISKSSRVILFVACPLALWSAMAFCANLLWVIIPFARFQ